MVDGGGVALNMAPRCLQRAGPWASISTRGDRESVTPADHPPQSRTSAARPALRSAPLGEIRHDWSTAEIEALFALPFQDLIFRAQQVHREHHVPNTVQMSTLLSIKTGACPEDCAYCPQSVRYDTGLQREC